MGAERVTAGRLDGGGAGWPWRVAGPVVVVLLAAVVGVGRARAALPPNCSQNAEVVTCSFSFTNFPDQTFEVPAGISSVGVVAVGAPGGPAGPRFPSPTPGGAGAVASGTLSVTGGQTLYVNVGGAGDPGFTDSAGGLTGAARVTPHRDVAAPAVVAVGERRMCAPLRIRPAWTRIRGS